MSKVTSKLQVTIPKAVADAHGIRPGTHLEFEPAGEWIRVRIAGGSDQPKSREGDEWRLARFDLATARQAERELRRGDILDAADRGWKREDLYNRGLPG
ncbi:MAG: AbrB/MazE/SpoVT family DNA-binding domain-containing protein [Planctomycetes bacterium]|nr:AbrB/MazE/SpoVT family DNA-binding domain-containing protein [Planctomycetota bacterium]